MWKQVLVDEVGSTEESLDIGIRRKENLIGYCGIGAQVFWAHNSESRKSTKSLLKRLNSTLFQITETTSSSPKLDKRLYQNTLFRLNGLELRPVYGGTRRTFLRADMREDIFTKELQQQNVIQLDYSHGF